MSAELQASVEKLTKALESEREGRKADKAAARQFRASIAKPLGLAEDVADDALIARAGDVERVIGERTAGLTKERDDARAKATAAESRWASDRIDRALSDAFAESGMKGENLEDALAIARPLFAVNERGEVLTKADAPNTVPNVGAQAWAFGELRGKRPHWFPPSLGGGARGGRSPHAAPADDRCFKPGATWNVTAQMRYADTHGDGAAASAARRHGVNVPWLKGGAA